MSSGSPGDEQKLKDMITRFYAIAGETPPSQLRINDGVADVFGKMMRETEKCTEAMSYVPIPPAGRITVIWIATYIWGMVFDAFSEKLSVTCVEMVLLKWKSQLELAGRGL